MTALIIQSYGRESEYRRAVFTILSFWTWNSEKQVSIVLFTDKPSYFAQYIAGLPVEFILITPDNLQDMKGAINFVHRVKIAIIEEVFIRLQPKKVLYVDSDTYFNADAATLLAQISEDTSVMHEREYTFDQLAISDTLGNSEAQTFIDLIKKGALITSRSDEKFHSQLYAWNAGVLGLNASVASFLQDVYKLTDEIYLATSWHTSEQNAFSLILQSRTQIISAKQYIQHYWSAYDKQAVDAILSAKLTDSLAQLPLAERLISIKQWTIKMPIYIENYFVQNSAQVETLQLQIQAIQSFSQKQVIQGYRKSFAAFIRAPRDIKFIKDVLYHTKRLIFNKL